MDENWGYPLGNHHFFLEIRGSNPVNGMTLSLDIGYCIHGY